LSADYNWLTQGSGNPPGGHLSASLGGLECSEKVLQEFQMSLKMFVANWRKCSTQEIISCVIWYSHRQYYRRKV